MADRSTTDASPEENAHHALTEVLDRLEASVHGETTSIGEILEGLGGRSFAAVILIPALLAVSPLSGVPGVTVTVGLITAATAAQMLWGRDCLWLPERITRRGIPTARLCKAIGWIRRPIGFVERFLRPRLTFLFHRPLSWLLLTAIFLAGLAMPVLELIPMTGTIAATAISFMAAGLLTRDGILVLIGFGVALGAPFLIWQLASGIFA